MKSKILLTVAALTAAAAVSFAQPERKDTIRTKTWSIYLQGGAGSFHGMRGPELQYRRDTPYWAPEASFGFMYYPVRWLRLGLDFGYTYLKSADRGIIKESQTFTDYEFDRYIGTLTVDRARIQNRNFTNTASTDFTIGLNFVDIWKDRDCQWFNMWLYAGVGYMHGWNRYTNTWAVDEYFVSTYYNNSHSYVESVYPPKQYNQFDAVYIPAGLSMEFDVIPQLTIGVLGQYRYFPQGLEHTPTGMWHAGLVLRFNILKSKVKSSPGNTDDLRNMARAMNTSLKEMNVAPVPVPVPLPEPEPVGLQEVDEFPGKYAIQIAAYRKYQHGADDSIFYGDNPLIFRNGDLRRYVIPANSLEEAQTKLKSLLHKYYDAFIVTINDKGIVVPYEP